MSIPKTTVREAWYNYRSKIVPSTASDIQIQETKRAFYGGAFSFLKLMLDNLDKDDMEPTEEDLKMMDDWYKEIESFFEAVKRGDQ